MRRTELAANLIFVSPILAAILMTCVLATPLNIFIALFCYTLGLLSLVHAKVSLLRQGVWVSFGPSRMAPQFRRSYWLGYAFIAVGVFINILTLLVIGHFGHSI
jgi:hypothetical protein